jgi:hypothetical protein
MELRQIQVHRHDRVLGADTRARLERILVEPLRARVVPTFEVEHAEVVEAATEVLVIPELAAEGERGFPVPLRADVVAALVVDVHQMPERDGFAAPVGGLSVEAERLLQMRLRVGELAQAIVGDAEVLVGLGHLPRDPGLPPDRERRAVRRERLLERAPLIVDAREIVERRRLHPRGVEPIRQGDRLVDVPPGAVQIAPEEMELPQLAAGAGEPLRVVRGARERLQLVKSAIALS